MILFCVSLLISMIGVYGDYTTCNWGYVPGWGLFREGYCNLYDYNVFVEGWEGSFEVTCDYSGDSAAAYVTWYDETTCSGSGTEVDLTEFECCEACEDECETLEMEIEFYQAPSYNCSGYNV